MCVWVDHRGCMQDFFDSYSLIYIVAFALGILVDMSHRATVDCRGTSNPRMTEDGRLSRRGVE